MRTKAGTGKQNIHLHIYTLILLLKHACTRGRKEPRQRWVTSQRHDLWYPLTQVCVCVFMCFYLCFRVFEFLHFLLDFHLKHLLHLHLHLLHPSRRPVSCTEDWGSTLLILFHLRLKVLVCLVNLSLVHKSCDAVAKADNIWSNNAIQWWINHLTMCPHQFP